jgi:hypothetical protein
MALPTGQQEKQIPENGIVSILVGVLELALEFTPSESVSDKTSQGWWEELSMVLYRNVAGGLANLASENGMPDEVSK